MSVMNTMSLSHPFHTSTEYTTVNGREWVAFHHIQNCTNVVRVINDFPDLNMPPKSEGGNLPALGFFVGHRQFVMTMGKRRLPYPSYTCTCAKSISDLNVNGYLCNSIGIR